VIFVVNSHPLKIMTVGHGHSFAHYLGRALLAIVLSLGSSPVYAGHGEEPVQTIAPGAR
jgi:hypothetical protein